MGDGKRGAFKGLNLLLLKQGDIGSNLFTSFDNTLQIFKKDAVFVGVVDDSDELLYHFFRMLININTEINSDYV